MRLYAIGDVHGCADLLGELHRCIADDLRVLAPAGPVRLVHLGDYVDRGPDSRAVLDRLVGAPPTGVDEVINLCGNHEDLMRRFLDDSVIGRAWMQLGGDATLASYGIGLLPEVPPAERFEVLRHALLDALPQAHRDLLDGLALHYRCGDYLFVHAGVRPARRWERQRAEDLLWIRDVFLQSNADHGAVVVHGHHVTAAPEQHANRIGIDTGAYQSGVLTCLVLEGAERRFLQTGSPRG